MIGRIFISGRALLWLTATTVSLAAVAGSPALAQGAAGAITVWNGTRVPLKFDIVGGNQSLHHDIASAATLALPCLGNAQIAIKTGESSYVAPVSCGTAYRLFYDATQRQYAVATLPAPDGAADAANSPIQQILRIQNAAAANRAAAAASAAPDSASSN